jgi:hypothetical protein
MITVVASVRRVSFTAYCVDLPDALRLCACVRAAGGRVVSIDASAPVEVVA